MSLEITEQLGVNPGTINAKKSMTGSSHTTSVYI